MRNSLFVVHRMTIHLVLVLGLILTTNTSKAQDAIFSQPYSAPLYLNPALTGSTGAGRFASLFRDQWPGLRDGIYSGGFTTYYASYDHYIKKCNSGLGFSYIHDQLGSYQANDHFGLSFAYPLYMNERKLKLTPGIGGSFVLNKLNLDKVILFDPTENITPDITYLDLVAGIQVTSSRLNLGIILDHITQPDISFIEGSKSRLPMKFSGILDYTFGNISEEKSFKVNVGAYYTQQSESDAVSGNIVLSWWRMRLGLAYRGEDAFIIKAGYEGNIFHLRYSYDITASELTNSETGGTHEVTTVLNLFRKKKPDDFTEMNNFHF